jgi:hypothetical protein
MCNSVYVQLPHAGPLYFSSLIYLLCMMHLHFLNVLCAVHCDTVKYCEPLKFTLFKLTL